MKKERLNIIPGTKYGKLTVVSESDPIRLPCGQINRIINCDCDCGNKTKVRLLHLVRGRISSCGCLKRTRNGISNTNICKVWREMVARCDGKTYPDSTYTKKNIKVCDEWINSFDKFYKWSMSNGYKHGLQIDRINNSKGYNPGNCRWTTCKINSCNKDVTTYVTYKGKKESLVLLLEEKGLQKHIAAIRGRICRGWNHDTAIDTKIRNGNYKPEKYMDDNIVNAIREKYRGGKRIFILAKEYKTSRTNIANIVHNKTYKRVS